MARIEHIITMKISKAVADELCKLKRQGETYDSVIQSLIISYYESNGPTKAQKTKKRDKNESSNNT